jgi:hypothetical protein
MATTRTLMKSLTYGSENSNANSMRPPPLSRKLLKFAYNLEPAHTAELWYEARTPTELGDWKVFYAAFTERWPKPTVNIPT